MHTVQYPDPSADPIGRTTVEVPMTPTGVQPSGGGVDLTDPELCRHGFPHEVFSELRRHSPVHWQSFPDGFPGNQDEGFWVLSRYDDVQAASRDGELFSAFDGPMLSHQPAMQGTMLVSTDGRAHVRLRRLVNSGFTPNTIRGLDETTRTWARSIVRAAVEAGTCDFVRDIAYQLPMHMIADIVGVPVEDRERLFSLTAEFLQAGDAHHPATDEEQLLVQIQMFEYAQALGAQKRSHPRNDIWTILSSAEVESEGGGRTALTQTELDMFFLLLVIAGSETTRNAMSVGMLTLLGHPDQLGVLRHDIGAIPSAVEEMLRWSSPLAYFARRATRDTELRGVRIAAGERITMWYPSANRDADVFDDPFRFDIGRTPNPHVAFGGTGAHFCLGANLARREMVILFEELLEHTRAIELVGAPSYNPLGILNPILVNLNALPVRLT